MKRLLPYSLILFCLGYMSADLRADDKQTQRIRTRDEAIAKIERDDVENATELLSERNTGKRGTVTWYLQSAAELTDMAHAFKASGDYEGSRRAAQAVIKMYAHALKQKGAAASAGDRAELLLQMAQVYDLLLGDAASARKTYVKALHEVPDNLMAQQALARYAEEDSKAERIKSRKK